MPIGSSTPDFNRAIFSEIRKFGEEGKNTSPAPGASLTKTVVVPEDGFTMVSPDDMYRINELSPGRREPFIHNLHNLSDAVFQRTLTPSKDYEVQPKMKRRAMLWDKSADAVMKALVDIPKGSHINVCANSGPYAAKLEQLPPWTTVESAYAGLLFVTEFRKEDENIHPGWIQIATPIDETEGRLMAGLRLLPAVIGRSDLTFTITNLTHHSVALHLMNLVKDCLQLEYGCVANSWRPTNLGCFFHRGGAFLTEYSIFRDSFAWDGDLYGWDEAMLYTRCPVSVITYEKPNHRFDYMYTDTVLRNVTWYHVVDGRLYGGFHAKTTRADCVKWDADVIEGRFIDEEEPEDV